MTVKKNFDMGTTRQAQALVPAEREQAITDPSPAWEEEPLDRMNFVLPRRLRILFNKEAAARDIKKQDLVREIFEAYFDKK